MWFKAEGTQASAKPGPKGSPPAERVGLHPLHLLRISSRFSAVNLAGFFLAIPTNLVVAHLLGPEQLGMVAYVTLWTFYGALVQVGAHTAAVREVSHLLGKGRLADAEHVQNVGITVEALAKVVPAIAIMAASMFHRDPFLQNGLLLAGLAVIVASARDLPGGFHWAHERYGVQAGAAALTKVGTPAFVLLTVWWLGPYSVLLAPIVVGAAGVLYYLRRAPSLGLRWALDLPAARRLVRVGFPMMLLGLFYWAFREMGRTGVASWMSFEALGQFVLAMTVVSLAIALVADFGNVLQPALWREMARPDRAQGIRRQIASNGLMLLAMGCALASFGQATFGWFVVTFLPVYGPSIATFEVLAFLIPLSAGFVLPMILLNSPLVDRQNLNAVVWGAGLVVGSALSYVALASWKLDLEAFSWVLVAVSAGLAAVLLRLILPYIQDASSNARFFAAAAAGLLATTAALFGAYRALDRAVSEDAMLLLGLRVLLAGGTWALAAIVLRWTWPAEPARAEPLASAREVAGLG
jgi:O-antigen/teichoic acid export membrane protein